ncbi:hypothetical protein IN820_09725 [Pseudomonas sp. AL-54]|nr:hypothetical protein [Pseudomonas lopnurensis]
MSLIELVITIVVLGIVLTALYSAQASIVGRSADPLLTQQSLYIADGVLETLQALPAIADIRSEAPKYSDNTQSLPLPVSLADRYKVEVGTESVTLSDETLEKVTVTVTPTAQPRAAVTLIGYRADY